MEADRRMLELALVGLEAERQRILKELEVLGNGRSIGSKDTAPATATHSAAISGKRSSPNKGVKMSEEQKRKISQAMKARWSAFKRQGRRAAK